MSKKMRILLGLILISSMLLGAEKYAVLITGDYADDRGDFGGSWAISNERTRDNPMEEFWHDTFLMWEMLIEKGYEDDNIFVLFAGGQDFTEDYILQGGRYIVPGEYPDGITDYQADYNNVDMIFTSLADGNQQENIPQLQEDDFLMIWTFDHGLVHDEHTWLQLIGDDEISDEDFGDLVDQINCQKKVIFMQQCYSGGFANYLENENSIVFTSTNAI